jgi:FkbH-like protein
VTEAETENPPLDLVVAANFTAGPVEASLRFWLEGLQLPVSVSHAPYDQAFQQLLDPESVLRRNRHGIGLVLVRLQGWLATDGAPGQDMPSDPDRIARELVAAVTEALRGASSQLVVCFCPSTGLDAETRATLARAERVAADALRDEAGVRVLTSEALLERYPCDQVADPQGERIADMPYTPAFYSVLGTALARSIYGLVFPAHKVLVLDCDDTLWGGLCGELGPLGVALTEEHLALQRFAVEQRRDGKLICLASRNNEGDVFAVFDRNPAMALTRDDLTAWQINWGLKSDSLAELADRLGLGLDSFVFLDDDPVQCAEVRRRFPEVLALQVPKRGVERFCQHIWPLDPRSSTAEGSRRTASYREHVAREDVRASSQSFRQFLDSLELEVDIAPLEEADVPRATELTHRTNQFNLTGRRLNEAEFRNRIQHGEAPCLGVRVRDRFGDYGLVGLVLAEPDGDALRVPVMLLSCRSLGRGVEHRMVSHLGRLARSQGADRVVLRCVPTERNDPAREFLRRIGEVATEEDGSLSLALDAGRAESVALDLGAAPRQPEPPMPGADTAGSGIEDPDIGAGTGAARRSTFLATVPAALAEAAAIHEAVHGESHEAGPGSRELPPATGETAGADPVEALLVQLFAGQLGVAEFPLDAGFFELGGDSLQAVQVLAQVSTAFGVELDPTLLFTTNFTVGELAEEINSQRAPDDDGDPGGAGLVRATAVR